MEAPGKRVYMYVGYFHFLKIIGYYPSWFRRGVTNYILCRFNRHLRLICGFVIAREKFC